MDRLEMEAEKQRLLEEWKRIDSADASFIGSSDFCKLKQRWFADVLKFINRLPSAENLHLWCAHRSIVWPLLESFSGCSWDRNLLSLAQKMFQGDCFRCIASYWQAKNFFREVYPEDLIGPLLRRLLEHDEHRVVSTLRQAYQHGLTLTGHHSCMVLEVLLFPDLLQSKHVQKIISLFLRYAALHDEKLQGFQEALLGQVPSNVEGYAEKISSSITFLSGDPGLERVLKLAEFLLSSIPRELDIVSVAKKPPCVDISSEDDGDEDMEPLNIKVPEEEEKTELKRPFPFSNEENFKRPRCVSSAAANGKPEPEEAQSDLSARIPPLKQLDGWYKQVLSLDVFNLSSQPTEPLTKVPLWFRSYQHYLSVFRPLLFEELRSQVERAMNPVNPSQLGVLRTLELEPDGGNFFNGRYSTERGPPLAKNDLVILSKLPFQRARESTYMLAKVEKTARRNRSLLLKLYLPDPDVRLAAAARNHEWHVTKLMPITPFIREQQAILALKSFPLQSTILSPSPAPVQQGHSIPPLLWSKLAEEYNTNQLECIRAIMSPGKAHEMFLVQGPPGTGKTRTILALLSTLLQLGRALPDRFGEATGAEQLSKMWNELHSNALSKSTRILVCAQSNGAVDELVSRILNNGIYDAEGNFYRPNIVRVGDTKKVQPEVMPVHIDNLSSQEIASEAGRPGASTAELRSRLEKIRLDMQALEVNNHRDSSGKMSELLDLQEQQRRGFMELVHAEDYEEHYRPDKKASIKINILRRSEVVLSTITGCGGKLYSLLMEAISRKDPRSSQLLFDAVIVDEAAQAVEPSILIPLQLLKSSHGKCILVGDPKQLPPTIFSMAAVEKSLDTSLFERLQSSGYPVTILNTQYRMHPEIRRFPSFRFYGDQLRDGIGLEDRDARFHKERMFGPYLFFDVPHAQEKYDTSCQSFSNTDEVELVFQLARGLKARFPNEVLPGRIAILTPYQEQRRLLREKFSMWNDHALREAVDICTIDSFQGREVDILILSMVRASAGVGFLADVRRMNVALTRAKYALWIVGNSRTLVKNPDWCALVEDAQNRGLFHTMTISSFSSPATAAMAPGKRSEGAGWDSLPSDLLERVCLRLDVIDVCRIRAVCREWSSFLRSPVFMRNYAARATAPGSLERWIVVYTDQMYAFVNGRRWVAVSTHPHWRLPRRHEEEYQADCVADGALVCVSRRSLINNNSVREVFLYNPVAKLRLDLPRLIDPHSSIAQWPQWRPWALSSGPGPSSFRIIFLRYKSPEMHLYDAATGAWLRRTIPKPMLQETVLHDDFTHTATCINGIAYCINWDRSSVLTYDLHADSWGKIDTPLTRHSRNYLLIEPQIVKGSRVPILVAGVRKRRNFQPGRWRRRDADDQADVVSIWDLDTSSMTWTKVCEKSCELPSYTLAGNEQQIFVIPHGSGDVLAYDLSSKAWQRRPSVPSQSCFSMATFSLEARF